MSFSTHIEMSDGFKSSPEKTSPELSPSKAGEDFDEEFLNKHFREVLIAEDSPTQAERLRYILEKNGYTTHLARNGKEALEMALELKPPIVISDIIMPEMDGYELCSRIKKTEDLSNTLVILLTTLSDFQDVIRGLESGADNFITKPYQEQYLLTRLRFMLMNRSLQQRERVQMGIEIYFAGQKHVITSERQQILGLLLSTYETAVQKNAELRQAKADLQALNDDLERKVLERTKALQRQLRRTNALRTIDMAITGTLDPAMVMDIISREVADQLEVDAVNIMRFDPSRNVLHSVAHRGFHSDKISQLYVAIGEGYAGSAALERKVVAIANLEEESTASPLAELCQEEGFRSYYACPLIAKGNLLGVIEICHRTPLSPDQEWLQFLEMLARQAAIAIDNAMLVESLRQSNSELFLAYETTLEGWSRALDLRDHETEGHTKRVTDITIQFARRFGLSEEELVHLRRGAMLHDIGKVAVPDSILLKPGQLDDTEWEMMKKHPVHAHELLAPIAYLRPALDIPHCHHEKWDGTGYPRGLKGEGIPLGARIFAVVDIWDALRSNRPYRKAWPENEVFEHIHSLAGTHLDPKVVEEFMNFRPQLPG